MVSIIFFILTDSAGESFTETIAVKYACILGSYNATIDDWLKPDIIPLVIRNPVYSSQKLLEMFQLLLVGRYNMT